MARASSRYCADSQLLLVHLLTNAAELKPVAKILEGLPLALDQAGSLLHQSSYTIDDYIRSWHTEWEEVAADMGEYEDTHEYQTNRAIHTTWNISFEHVRKYQDGRAAKLLQLSSYLNHRKIEYNVLRSSKLIRSWRDFNLRLHQLPDWFQKVIETDRSLDKAVSVLKDYSLIKKANHAMEFSVHPVVHSWCYSTTTTSSDDHYELARIALFVVASGYLPYEDPLVWLSDQTLLPHCERLLSILQRMSKKGVLIKPEDTLMRETIASAGSICRRQYDLKSSAQFLLRALPEYLVQDVGSSSHHPQDIAAPHLKFRSPSPTRLSEASESRFLNGIHGIDDITIRTCELLSFVYLQNNDPRAAATVCEYVVAEASLSDSASKSSIATILSVYSNLASVYTKLGKLDEAQLLLDKVVQEWENSGRPSDEYMYIAFTCQGGLHNRQSKRTKSMDEKQEQRTKSINAYRQAVNLREKMYGPEVYPTLLAVYILGKACYDLEEDAVAEVELKRAWVGFQKLRGIDPFWMYKAVNVLALVYHRTGRLKDGALLLESVIENYEQIRDLEDRILIPRNLRIIYGNLGSVEKITALRLDAKVWAAEMAYKLDRGKDYKYI